MSAIAPHAPPGTTLCTLCVCSWLLLRMRCTSMLQANVSSLTACLPSLCSAALMYCEWWSEVVVQCVQGHNALQQMGRSSLVNALLCHCSAGQCASSRLVLAVEWCCCAAYTLSTHKRCFCCPYLTVLFSAVQIMPAMQAIGYGGYVAIL
jgi:hypothetical protein